MSTQATESKEFLQGMLESLNAQREQLNAQLEQLDEKKKTVLSSLSKKNEPTAEQPTRQDLIIVFVEEIEKAHQYYEFKDFLRENSVVKPEHDAVKNLKYLVKELKVQEELRFNKLDCKLIMDAVEGYIWNQNRKKLDWHKESIQGNTNAEVSSDEDEGNDWYTLMSLEKRTSVDPIVRLVYHIREKGHVMDEDPLVELGYIQDFDWIFYKSCFVWRLLQKRSEREVIAHFVPLHLKEKDMEDALSDCGNAVSVKFKSEGPRCLTKRAYVIFENSIAAKLAPVMKHNADVCFVGNTTIWAASFDTIGVLTPVDSRCTSIFGGKTSYNDKFQKCFEITEEITLTPAGRLRIARMCLDILRNIARKYTPRKIKLETLVELFEASSALNDLKEVIEKLHKKGDSDGEGCRLILSTNRRPSFFTPISNVYRITVRRLFIIEKEKLKYADNQYEQCGLGAGSGYSRASKILNKLSYYSTLDHIKKTVKRAFMSVAEEPGTGGSVLLFHAPYDCQWKLLDHHKLGNTNGL